MIVPRLVIAGTHSGVGKTTVTLAILAALKARGRQVQPFKAGPDFIDPGHHSAVTGRPSHNLDGWILGEAVNRDIFTRAAADADLSIIEGMMYLTQAIRDFAGTSHEMVGLFPAEAVMRKPDLTLGYRTVALTQGCILGASGTTARGHEFHYSTLVPKGSLDYACALHDARGELKGSDGLVVGNTLALYTHLHFFSHPEIAKSLVSSVRRTSPRLSVSRGGPQ
jgi:cobyrinic acid a,c-diamide synthase